MGCLGRGRRIFEVMTRNGFFEKFTEGDRLKMEETFLLVEDVYITPVKKYSRNRCPSFSNILKTCSPVS